MWKCCRGTCHACGILGRVLNDVALQDQERLSSHESPLHVLPKVAGWSDVACLHFGGAARCKTDTDRESQFPQSTHAQILSTFLPWRKNLFYGCFSALTASSASDVNTERRKPCAFAVRMTLVMPQGVEHLKFGFG